MDERTALDVAPAPPPDLAPTGLGVLPVVHLLAPSPINRRRWQNFKANRRGYWAFWLFGVLFLISLLAEVIAQQLPGASEKDRLALPRRKRAG